MCWLALVGRSASVEAQRPHLPPPPPRPPRRPSPRLRPSPLALYNDSSPKRERVRVREDGMYSPQLN
jgi:hypothetical protein